MNTNAAFAGMQWFFIVNLFQKVVTFILNQCLIRWTSPEIFGMAAVQLELLISTILFLSREGIRLATLREVISDDSQFQKIVNISCLPAAMILVVIIILIGSIAFGFRWQGIDIVTVLFYCIGAFSEALGEPIFNSFQNNLQLSPQLTAESAAVFTRSVVTVIAVGSFNLGVRGFGIAQMSYGVIHVLVMIFCLPRTPIFGRVRRLGEFLPSQSISSNQKGFVDMQLFVMACTTTGSSLLKHLLTEADRIILSMFASHYDQGIFAVANNYGSLVARLIFLPVENGSRLAFSKLSSELISELAQPNSDALDQAVDSRKFGDQLQKMSTMLSRILATVSCFAILFPIFGLPYVPLLVNIVFSAKWRSPETIRTLSAFCFYLPVLGINGVIEAFVQAVAPSRAFVRLNLGLVAGTIVYVSVAIPLIQAWGTSGVVTASICSMSVRIVSNSLFMHSYFSYPNIWLQAPTLMNGQTNLTKSLFGVPSPLTQLWIVIKAVIVSVRAILTILVIAVFMGIMWTSHDRFAEALGNSSDRFPVKDAIVHVAIGAACFLGAGAMTILQLPRHEISNTIRMLRGKSD